MFTGIVQCTGVVAAVEPSPGGEATRLAIAPAGDLAAETRPPRAGDSISVAGVCLTIADLAGEQFYFDVVPETLRCTTLGALNVDERVNLEPAVAPHQPMGGHFMQGHVDALGEVIELQQRDGEVRLVLSVPASLMDCISVKGSIAIDGVSLTVASMSDQRIEIALIPTTLEATTLGALKAGDAVNLETDMLARTVVQWLERHGGPSRESAGGVTRQMLEDGGFDKMG